MKSKPIIMKLNGEVDVVASLKLQQKIAQLAPPNLIVRGLKPLGNGIYEVTGEVKLSPSKNKE